MNIPPLEIVHGAKYWQAARFCALESGIEICANPPPVCVAALALRDNCREYVGSVGAVEHDGLLMYEWLVVNRHMPAKLRHAAVELLMIAGGHYAAAVGKKTIMIVDKRRAGGGIRTMAERLGFARRNEALEVLEGDL
jgi:hypothetical protein